MFNKQSHDFGDVQEGQTLTTQFEYLGSKTIQEIEPKCSCTNFTIQDNIITVNWKIKKKNQERLATTYLSIIFTDNSVADLDLIAYVKHT